MTGSDSFITIAPPRRLKKHAHELRLLAKCSPHQRKAFLRHADPSLITSLCECVSNVVKGNVPVSKLQGLGYRVTRNI